VSEQLWHTRDSKTKDKELYHMSLNICLVSQAFIPSNSFIFTGSLAQRHKFQKAEN